MTMAMRLMAVMAAVAVALPLSAQERYTVGGDDVAIYNLAGEVTVTGASDGAVSVEVLRAGRDAERLDVQVGEIQGRQALRVMYPADRISYEGFRRSGNTTIQVRSDGTWGGGSSWFSRGDRVRISSRGGGLEAHADLRISVPEGQRVAVYLAVGRIMASNVNGRVLLDTHSGGVEARDMTGSLNIDTGSGSVSVIGMDGDLGVDTGSGSVRIADVTAEAVGIDTGSGSVQAEDVAARGILIDTGSGRIRIARSSARDIRLDTGSGSVEADLLGSVDRLLVDTGSGSVTVTLPSDIGATLEVETGSGGIDVDIPVMVTRQARDELQGTIGDGSGRIVIDTGSGSVRIRGR